jgi:hypothetical protein
MVALLPLTVELEQFESGSGGFKRTNISHNMKAVISFVFKIQDGL